jgi:Tol biopolymer transport system component
VTQNFGEFIDEVEGWLATAPVEEDPESVLARIVAELDATPQQRWPWIVLPTLDTSQAMGFGLGVAATILGVVVGVQLLEMSSGTGGHAPSGIDRGDIAFVHAVYDPPGFSAEDVRILAVSSEGGDPALLGAPPGNASRLFRGAFPNNPRNDERVGPSVSWSPDGARIAFRLFNDAPGIYLMNRDGSGLRQLVDLPRDRNSGMGSSAALDWSPNGSQLTYSYPYSLIRSPLYVVDTADGTVRNLTGPDTADGVTRTVAWSPDGSMIAFVRTEEGGLPRGSGLFVMNADGTAVRQLPTGSEPNPQVLGLAWSPDGSMIAFLQDMGDATDPAPHRNVLRVINVDGTGMRDLVEPIGGGCCTWVSTDERLAWSPDGTSVATIRWTEGGRVVVVVNADGSGERSLTAGGDFSWFDWSPDGSQLVVFEQRTYSIQVVNADGSGQRWLANGEFPAWAPASDGS